MPLFYQGTRHAKQASFPAIALHLDSFNLNLDTHIFTLFNQEIYGYLQ